MQNRFSGTHITAVPAGNVNLPSSSAVLFCQLLEIISSLVCFLLKYLIRFH